MDNEKLYEKALEAATDLFNDQSVSKKKVLENLKSLIEDIQVMIESLGF